MNHEFIIHDSYSIDTREYQLSHYGHIIIIMCDFKVVYTLIIARPVDTSTSNQNGYITAIWILESKIGGFSGWVLVAGIFRVWQTYTHLNPLDESQVIPLDTFNKLKCHVFAPHIFLKMISLNFMDSPQLVIAKESPIDNVEQNKWGGKEPPWDPVDQYSLFALLFHHIPNLLLSLQLYVMNKVLDAQLRTYHIISSTTAATHRIRPKASSSTRW